MEKAGAVGRRAFLSGSLAVGTMLASGAGAMGGKLELDKALAEALVETKAPGVGAMILGSGGRVDALAVAGVRVFGRPDKVQSTDKWHLGSNTKAMTAVLAARLAERGGVGLDAPVAEVVSDANDAWKRITLADLLAHRAGLRDRDVLGPTWLLKARMDQRSARDQRAELLRQVVSAAPSAPPGSFAYGNLNYMVAAALLEAKQGKSWEELIAAEVFSPLKMESAGLGAPLGQQPWGHMQLPDGTILPLDPAGVADNPAAMGPAGGVHASLADYARFLGLFLGGQGSFLSAPSLARLTTVPAGQAYAPGWGVIAEAPWAGGRVLAHEGSNTLWHVTALLAPERKVGVVAVANAAFGLQQGKGPARVLAEKLTRLVS